MSDPRINCDVCIEYCPTGTATQYRLIVESVAPDGEGGCEECGEINGEYILDSENPSCLFDDFLDTECYPGSVPQFVLEIIQIDCKPRFQLILVHAGSVGVWENHEFYDCLRPSYTLTGTNGGDGTCFWPDTMRIEPIPPDSSTLQDAVDCRTPRSRFCASQSNLGAVATEAMGQLDVACNQCCDTGSLSALTEGGGSCSSNACNYSVNPVNGNLVVSIGTPAAGSTAPHEHLFFNSRLGELPEFGSGVQAGIVGKRVDGPHAACNVELIDCDGTRFRFLGLQGDGSYAINYDSAPLAFRQTATGWLEERPRPGSKFYYDDNGRLITIENISGQRWTVIYDPERYILDPFERRTTYAFDEYSRLSSITDVHGRVTTFVIDTDGNLRERLSPELCLTEFLYGSGATLHQLQQIIEPDGLRTTFTYDNNGWINAILKPTGFRYTYTYVDWLTTKIIDPAGYATTLIHEPFTRKVAEVVNPLGQRTTYTHTTQTWNAGLTNSIVNPAGITANFTYTLTNDNLTQLESVSTPSGQMQFVYSGGAVTATVDPLGNRTTYIRDAANRLIAVVDALGFRTTYGYDAYNRRTLTINPLGNRSTVSYDSVGQIVTQMSAQGNITTYTYQNGQLASTINPLGFRVTTAYDQTNRVLERINPLNERITYTYMTGGRLWATVEPRGYRTTNVYDKGQLSAVINPLGHRTTLAYDSRGNKATTQDAFGYVSTVMYDEANRPHVAINSLGLRTTTVYDYAGRQWATISPSGRRSTTTYDASGRPQTLMNPLGFVTTSVYDAADHPIASINPLGFRSTTVYDAIGRPQSLVNPLGNTSVTVYDGAGQVWVTIDPLGFRSTTTHDTAGRVSVHTDPLGKRITYTYDKADRQTVVMNQRGYRTTFSYDAAHRLQSTLDHFGNRTTYTYDAAGNTISVMNARGHTTHSTYGATGLLDAVQNPLGQRTTFIYDPVSRQTAVTNALGFASTTVYDAAGRTLATINPLGYRTTAVYDQDSRPIAQIDANGKYTTTTYDAGGRAEELTNALGYITTTTYDAANRVTALINARGYRHSFTYDAADQRRSVMDPLGRATTASYDAAGRQSIRHDPRNHVTTYTYDGNRRLTKRLYPNATQHLFTFDDAGNRITMQDPTGTYQYSYDALNRETSSLNAHSLRLTYTYDSLGQRHTMIDPITGKRFTYTFDAAGRLESMIDPYGDRTTFTNDATGRRTLTKLADGTRNSITYDAADRITMISNFNADNSMLSTFKYLYDNVGNPTTMVDTSDLGGRQAVWTYDDAYQLRHENRGALVYNLTHVYDAVGNRVVVIGNSPATYTYDAANQLINQTSVGVPNPYVVTFTHDAAGNRGKIQYPSGTVSLIWDYENQLTAYGSDTYTYNADCQRIRSTVAGSARVVTWDGEAPLAQRELSGSLVLHFTSEPTLYGRIISWRAPGYGARYNHYDALGSVTEYTLPNFSPNYIRYKAFGDTDYMSTLDNLPLFIAREGYHYYFDSHLDYYVRRRWYDPSTARWYSADPLGVRAGGMNPYAYAGNRPLVFVDPSGLQECVNPTGRGVLYEERRGRFTQQFLASFADFDKRFPFVGAEERIANDVGSGMLARWVPNRATFFRQNCCCCDEIGYVQVIKREMRFRSWFPQNDAVYTIDGGIPYGSSTATGWGGFPKTTNPCTTPVEIQIVDHPGGPKGRGLFTLSSLDDKFETCVVCLTGIEGITSRFAIETLGNQVYGVTYRDVVVYDCFEWEHRFVRRPNGTYSEHRAITKLSGPPSFSKFISGWKASTRAMVPWPY